MREAKYNKSLTIVLAPEMFAAIKEITDKQRISMSEWFREAAKMKLATSDKKED